MAEIFARYESGLWEKGRRGFEISQQQPRSLFKFITRSNMVDSHGRSPIKQRITGENALHQSMMGNTFKCYQEDTFLIPFTMAITCDSVFTLICGDDFPLSQVRWRVNCLAPPPCDSGRQEHPSAGLFILFAD